MKKAILFAFGYFVAIFTNAQSDNDKWARAFPITDYQVELNDSVRVVQVYLPHSTIIKEKQVGVLKGVYTNTYTDTSMIGAGRCHLIKGDYYYFSINNKQSGKLPKENDLLYIIIDNPGVHNEQLLRIASHFIELQNVYEEPLFDRLEIFKSWKAADEQRCIDSMRTDIRFTGNHFLQNDPSMDVKIPGGKYKDQMVLTVMTKCTNDDVKDFLEYIIVRPRLYAGRAWKMSEIFATWLSSGSPTVVRE